MFWIVYPNISFIESGHSQIVMNKIKKGLVSNHIAFVYEDVCKEKMWKLNANNTWPFNFTKLGRYWDTKTEIDIVALDLDGKNLILGECKYWKEPVGSNILKELEKKTDSVSWEKNNRKVWYVLFSISGFSDELVALVKKRKDVLLFAE